MSKQNSIVVPEQTGPPAETIIPFGQTDASAPLPGGAPTVSEVPAVPPPTNPNIDKVYVLPSPLPQAPSYSAPSPTPEFGTGWGNRGQNSWSSEPAAPSEESLRKVIAAFDMRTLRIRCMADGDEILDSMPEVFGKPKHRHGFASTGSPVLAVAHSDWVAGLSRHFASVKLPTEYLVFSPQLDDRLGVYTVLDLLPRIGVPVDLLITEGEETGQSTGKDFKPPRDYHWMVEFDRRGEDAVCYQYYKMEDKLRPIFRVGNGSASDISAMSHLGVLGFNVGLGYENEHTNRCLFSLGVYIRQIARFLDFYNKFATVKLPYTPVASYSSFPQTYGLYGPRGTSEHFRLGRSSAFDEGYDEVQWPRKASKKLRKKLKKENEAKDVGGVRASLTWRFGRVLHSSWDEDQLWALNEGMCPFCSQILGFFPHRCPACGGNLNPTEPCVIPSTTVPAWNSDEGATD